MAAGQRPISNVVDITNFVMLCTGQPMHAFDADLIAGGRLVVRRAGDGERITTLDDVERTLDPDVCVIEDAEGPTSIAGIMGGARSEVNDGTTRVLMEAATWNGPNIQRTSTRLGLRTEASGRFEKGLQPEQGMDGQALAAKLMVELCGARPVGGTIDVGGPGAGGGDDPAARGPRRGAPRRPDPARRAGRDPRAAELRDRRGRRRPRRHRAVLAPRRRHPRGRSRRGGRAHLGLRAAAAHAAVAPRRQRPARAAPAPAPARRGRARRRGPVRDARLELRRAVARRPPADPGGRPAPPRRAARQPDVRGAVGPAHDAARLAARQPPAQPLARPRGRAAVGARRRLPGAQRGRGRERPHPGPRPPPGRARAPRGAAHRPPAPADLARRRARRARTSSPPRACSAR